MSFYNVYVTELRQVLLLNMKMANAALEIGQQLVELLLRSRIFIWILGVQKYLNSHFTAYFKSNFYLLIYLDVCLLQAHTEYNLPI